MADNETTPLPWDDDDPAWAALREAGIDPDDVEVRRYGVSRLAQAARRLDEAIWEWLPIGPNSSRRRRSMPTVKPFKDARGECIYPELKDAYEAFFGETRRAMGVLDADPRFAAALDAASTEVK